MLLEQVNVLQQWAYEISGPFWNHRKTLILVLVVENSRGGKVFMKDIRPKFLRAVGDFTYLFVFFWEKLSELINYHRL